MSDSKTPEYHFFIALIMARFISVINNSNWPYTSKNNDNIENVKQMIYGNWQIKM